MRNLVFRGNSRRPADPAGDKPTYRTVGFAERLGGGRKELTCAKLSGKEAFEDAGIVGTVQKMATYSYWKRLPKDQSVTSTVDVFALKVAELLDDWPEKM